MNTTVLRSSKGFTLLEVLISIAIMATLSILAAQSIQSAIKSKKKIQEQVEDLSRLRDGLKLLERDINLAYHHRDWEKELLKAAKKKSAATGAQNPQQNQPGQDPNLALGNDQNLVVEAPRRDPVTHFIGEENSLHFVTMNNARLVKNRAQADHIEVGYFLKDCKSIDGKTSSKCLWRRSSPWVDRDVTKGGDEIVLLENITEFNLKYLGKKKQDWVNSWKTDKSGDAATQNNFPLAVEASVTVQKSIDGDKKGKKYSMQLVIPIHFPNNNEDGPATDDNSAAPIDPNQQSPANSGPALGGSNQ